MGSAQQAISGLRKDKGKVIPHPEASIAQVVRALKKNHGWAVNQIFVNGQKVAVTSDMVPKPGDMIRFHLAQGPLKN
ncbi:hypothetical protein EXS56_02700 [Candidatus Kaiserbacteria bacterium]|nr:hypothetical protein [Candidatus Kaiserbacteria bacterium]